MHVGHLELEGFILLRALGKVVTGEGGALGGLGGLRGGERLGGGRFEGASGVTASGDFVGGSLRGVIAWGTVLVVASGSDSLGRGLGGLAPGG